VTQSVLRAVRDLGSAACLPVTVARAWLAYAAHGMEGVNRIVRLAPKSRVIPLLRQFGARIGQGCDIESALVLHQAHSRYRNLAVGERCHLGKEVLLDLGERITLGDRVTVSMRVTILTHTDVGQSPLADDVLPTRFAPVHVGYGAYIGAGATLLPGVHIGDCAMVGAGSVVTRSVPPYTVVAGIPARLLRTIERPASPNEGP
jgi:maltose O-acetyltransferase